MAVFAFSPEAWAGIYYIVQDGLTVEENLQPAYQFGEPIFYPGCGGVLEGTKLQYHDEVVLGAEYELIAEWKAGVRYTHRELGRVLEGFTYTPSETMAASSMRPGLACGNSEVSAVTRSLRIRTYSIVLDTP